MDRRLFIALAGSAFVAAPAAGAAVPYRLDRAASVVAFTYQMNGRPYTGRMPVAAADILLDVDRPANSRVTAEIDASRADAGPFYATEALKSASVLDTQHYPLISFRSEKVTDIPKGARVEGPLTIKEVTRDFALDAQLYRPKGTQQGDRRVLSILMTGTLDRRQFGAGGYPAIVGPAIRLQILTRITLA